MFDTSPATPAMRFAQGMSLLTEALDMIGGVDPTDLDPHVLDGYSLGLLCSSRRIAAVQSAVNDRFATSGVWAATAARSAHAWVASQTNEPRGRTLGSISTGAAMRAHPEMGAAFTAGEVTSAHVDILARTAAKYPTAREQLAANADVIVDVARLTPPARFAQELEALCHRIDPAAVADDERKRDAEAYLHLSRIGDGMFRIDGLLPAEVGTHFAAALQAIRRRLRNEAKQPEPALDNTEIGSDSAQPSPTTDTDTQHEIDVLGNPIDPDATPVAAMDTRYQSRQNVDALRMLLTLVAPATNPDGTIAIPSISGARPVVHLTVDIDTLLSDTRATRAGWLERFGVPDTVISSVKAQFLACDSTIEPLILKDGQLVATLPSLQTVPAHLRKAVIRRDHTCRVNSCTAPIDEIHHLVFLSQGGPTSMSNLAGLCWFHHHLIHQGQWTLTGNANHELTLTNTTTGGQWTNRPPPKRRC